VVPSSIQSSPTSALQIGPGASPGMLWFLVVVDQ
jgi:hypothetical protein